MSTKQEISFSYNSNKKRLRVFKDGQLFKEITGDVAQRIYKRITE